MPFFLRDKKIQGTAKNHQVENKICHSELNEKFQSIINIVVVLLLLHYLVKNVVSD